MVYWCQRPPLLVEASHASDTWTGKNLPKENFVCCIRGSDLHRKVHLTTPSSSKTLLS